MTNEYRNRENSGTTRSNGILDTLKRLGLAHDRTIEVLSKNTRDVKDVTVLRDTVSKVIFIDGYYVGDETYMSGVYRTGDINAAQSYENIADSERRFDEYKQFVIGKNICDFGCGAGSFLYLSRPYANQIVGVELQQSYRDCLEKDGINCASHFTEVGGELDTVFLFHSFEHLPNPEEVLRAVRGKLKANGTGRIVIEVPHARDLLIQTLCIQEFIEFTLWSQHLILHTRESITEFLRSAGFRNILVEGVQRYGISNHISWMLDKMPGGHTASLSILETAALKAAYADALSRIDANDTLVAIATA
jgi:SAM-dependent methyltransferase